MKVIGRAPLVDAPRKDSRLRADAKVVRMERREMRAATDAPIYRKLADILAKDIRDGRYRVGTILPTELELAATYGVSRNTAQSAIRSLVAAGMLSRKRKVGTRVEATQPNNLYTAAISSLPELFADAQRSFLRIETVSAPRALPRELMVSEIPSASRWLEARAQRVARDSGESIGVSNVYIAERYASIRRRLKSDVPWVHQMMQEEFDLRISEVRQEVSVGRLAKKDAISGGAKAGTPVLRVVRAYFDDRGECFLVAENIHPEGRVKLETSWKMSRAR